MLQEYSRYRILQEFFDAPRTNFHMRELSRNTKIAQPSMLNHLKALGKEGLVLREKKSIYPTYRANRDNEAFKIYKRLNMVVRMYESKMLDVIYDVCFPSVIILFGSASLGEDSEESDIDIFIGAPQKKLDLEKYEKVLKRKINPFFEENFQRLNNELKTIL